MKIKIVFFAVVVLGLFVLACGCIEEGGEDGDGAGTASVEFCVTDKVTDEFSHVNATFSEIRLFLQTEDDNESYVSVVSEPKTVDLVYLNLSHINETLGVDEIEVGNYSKLWINVSNVVGVLNSTGETVNITVPSNWLKIQQLHLFNITKGNHTITIDIDLENSIHTFHGGEEYKFIPVISRLEHHHEHQLRFREHNHSKIRNMVGNRAPAIDILVNGTLVKKNAWVHANESVEFNASATLDVDDDDLTFTWDWDDGDTDIGAVLNHSFDGYKKVYKVTLTVSDGIDESVAVININIHVRGQGNKHGQD
ncbi:MAG: DUF4382 domain-containing protein [Petrotogales bacterium]